MTEKNALKMNLDHERKIVELQSRVNPSWKTFAI